MSYHCPNCGKRNRVSYNFCYNCGKRLKYLHLDEFKPKEKEEIKQFKVNEYIKLKLENGKTNIYVNNQKFMQCKYLLIEIPIEKTKEFNEVKSIDEASEKLDHSLENYQHTLNIPSEVEFWGHSSNIQVWAEYDYDTRLLHSNLAFPLLKKLTEVGDPIARRDFKEEIAKRIEAKEKNVINYLILENYLEYFNDEEKSIVFTNLKKITISDLQKKYKNLLEPQDLAVLLGIINENIDNPKLLAIKPIQMINSDTVVGFTLKSKRITRLNLIKCNLRKIPNSINNLTYLEELNLLRNKLTSLPESLGQLSTLKILNLNYNHIKKLPNSLENLNSIIEIKVEQNLLREIPDSISYMTSLELFSMWNNRIVEIPKSIGNLTKLKVLNLSYNSIEKLPNSINNLASLHTLDLSHNILKKLPEDLSGLKSLQNLWLSYNKIKELPLSLASLKNLKNLYLSGNLINGYNYSNRNNVLNELKNKGVNIW